MDPIARVQEQFVHAQTQFLDDHGDTPQGMGWTKPHQAPWRYQVMLDLVAADRARPGAPLPAQLLDLGCGSGHLYAHLRGAGVEDLGYTGIDVFERSLELARAKFPGVPFVLRDVLAEPVAEPEFDYVVMNGVCTWKNGASFDDMWEYTQRLVARAFAMAKRAVAFNVMTTHLDWQRDDLFHVPFDTMAAFVRSELTPHFQFRQDYGVFDYTTYAFRVPTGGPA